MLNKDLRQNICSREEVLTNKVYKGLPVYRKLFTGKHWIDGKPIYRKVIDFGYLPSSKSKNVDSGLTNVSIKNIYGFCTHSNNTTLFLTFSTSDGSSYSIALSYTQDNEISITTGIDRTTYYGYVTLEYTKNTD